jgi:hypothetical protein
MSDSTNTAEMRGLPDPNTAREGALERLRWTIDTLVQQAKDEAFSDLALCVDSVKQQVGRLTAFDRALVDLLPEHERDDAARFLRNRDAASLWAPRESDVPF